MTKRPEVKLNKKESKYVTKCRLSLENYLELESRLFELLDTVYIWDEWNSKKDFSSLYLANMLTNICIGIEETLKLLFINPENNLNSNFIDYFRSIDVGIKFKEKRIAELIREDYGWISISFLLDFADFREKLNKYCDEIIYIRPPLRFVFSDLFGEINKKPKWFRIYEDIKHNIFTVYRSATFEVVLDALAAYYLVAVIVAHEGSVAEKKLDKRSQKYTPWYEANIGFIKNVRHWTSNHWLSSFRSKQFLYIGVTK